MKKEEYLERLTEQIRCRKAREPVRREICQHIEEQTASYMEEGMSGEEAEAAAVRDMGDPEKTGIALDKIHRPQMAWRLIVLIGILGLAGIAVSSEILFAQEAIGAGGTFVIRQGVYFVLSFLAMIGICYCDYSRIAARAKGIYLCMALLLGVLLPRYGLELNGSIRWINLGGIAVNLLAFAFWLAPLYGAVLYTYKGQGYQALAKGILWMVPGLWGAYTAPSMSTAVVLFLTFAVLLSAAVFKKWFQVSRKRTLGILWGTILTAPAAVCFYVLKFGAGYQAERLRAVFDPASMGGPARMIRELLKSSRFIGGGVLNGEIGYIDYSEYALTYLIAYYGILAGILLTALIAWLFWRFMKISLKQKNQLGMMMGIGCSAALLLQFGLFLCNNLGFGMMGVSCPFFSYGCGEMMSSFMMFGLLLSIYRYEKVLA
ncbi:MAG: FtsW/RodA/SpoVE family cell cycle protein [Eubacteriales bacterium]|nr:FtsW/RodA/SpoVE family cell cycle protein [Eubacteriales bacterium]